MSAKKVKTCKSTKGRVEIGVGWVCEERHSRVAMVRWLG